MTRGRKPKPPHLRLLEGSHRDDRHGDEVDVREAVVVAANVFGPPQMPRFRGHAKAAWEKYIAPAHWLDASREPAAIAFCELYQEMRSAPTRFQASKHSQLRAYMGDLGLTDERNRRIEKQKTKDEHFDEQ